MVSLKRHNYGGEIIIVNHMKNLSLLILVGISFLLFLIGVALPGRDQPLNVIFVVAGVTLGFIFYLLSFWHVIKTRTLSSGRRIFWIVAIVCLPMIGNVIYLILQDAFTRKQVPKPQL